MKKNAMFLSREFGYLVWSGALMSLLCAALLLGTVYIRFVPLVTDAGWYSYPGLALYQGRDPSENLLDPQVLMQSSDGVRSAFGFETRTLLVLVHAAWFSIAGSELLSVHIFGILQWLVLAGLTGGAAWLVGRNLLAAVLIALMVLSDSCVISESLADLRPDVPIAITGLACLLAMLRYCLQPRAITAAVASTFAAGTVLMQSTGVIAFVGCATFACVYALLTKLDRGRLPWGLLLVPIVGVAAFSLRQPLLDLLVPTSVSPDVKLLHQFDLWSKLRHAYSAGVAAKATQELHRWADYFFISNAIHLFVLASGLGIGLWALIKEFGEERRLIASLILAFLSAVATITVFDPHFTSSHLVPVVCLGYVAAAPGFSRILCWSRRTTRDWMIVGVILAVAALKIAHGVHMYSSSIHDGVSNAAVERLMNDTVEALPGGVLPSHLFIAPTSLWLYLPSKTSVVLLDVRNRPWDASSPRWAGVSALVVDNDFLGYGWDKVVTDLLACGAAQQIGEVGQRSGGFYLISLRLIAPGCRIGKDSDH